jgi:hypothetical protein
MVQGHHVATARLQVLMKQDLENPLAFTLLHLFKLGQKQSVQTVNAKIITDTLVLQQLPLFKDTLRMSVRMLQVISP